MKSKVLIAIVLAFAPAGGAIAQCGDGAPLSLDISAYDGVRRACDGRHFRQQ